MKDSRELHEPFMKELKALLRKYDVEIWSSSGDEGVTIEFTSNENRYWSELTFRSYIDGTED